MLQRVAQKLFRSSAPSHSGALKRVPLSSLAADPLEVRLQEVITQNGNVSGEELLAMCALIKHANCKAVFEIGTFDGRTTLNFAANLPDGGEVVTLDLPAEGLDATRFAVEASDRQYIAKSTSGARFQGRPEAARIRQVFGDSGTFDFTPFNGRFDFVFVDGSHSYDYVKSDSQVALRLLRGGRGMIVWHDYGTPFWPGVTSGLDELAKSSADFANLCVIEDTRLAFLRK